MSLNNMLQPAILTKQQLITAANGLGSQLVDAYAGNPKIIAIHPIFDAVINEAIHDYGLKRGRYHQNGYQCLY